VLGRGGGDNNFSANLPNQKYSINGRLVKGKLLEIIHCKCPEKCRQIMHVVIFRQVKKWSSNEDVI
jgi:hypothetical protein